MKQFYNLKEGYNSEGESVRLFNNWRHPQPLNDRVVYRSFSTREKLVEYKVGQSQDTENAASRVSSIYGILLPLLALLGLTVRL